MSRKAFRRAVFYTFWLSSLGCSPRLSRRRTHTSLSLYMSCCKCMYSIPPFSSTCKFTLSFRERPFHYVCYYFQRRPASWSSLCSGRRHIRLHYIRSTSFLMDSKCNGIHIHRRNEYSTLTVYAKYAYFLISTRLILVPGETWKWEGVFRTLTLYAYAWKRIGGQTIYSLSNIVHTNVCVRSVIPSISSLTFSWIAAESSSISGNC